MNYMGKVLALVIGVWSATVLTSSAVQAAYEGFDITPGPGALSGASGATSSGWTNTWTAGVANNVMVDSLGYTNNGALTTSGGAAQLTVANGGSFRHFAPPYATATGTYWISFTAVVPTNSSYAGLSLVNAFNEMLFIGDLSGGTTWGAQAYGTNGLMVSSALPVTNSAFIVARVDFNVGGTALDDTRIWINPDLSAGAPADGAATLNLLGVNFSGSGDARFGRVRLQQGTTGNNAIFDEIRLGTTWDDVSPHTGSYTPPPPASFAAISASAGQFQISVSNLTVGATNELHRAYDLSGSTWETTATFVATSGTNLLVEPVASGGPAVFYRMVSY